ncbi:MAG: CDP-alcohol phosphatidyltransferase family protein [Ignavibacteriaceae bacterium]|nr:CDP-alcohol phosphatidyltransferase family protein [Ignavibacteriaceae bacterium]
MKVNFKELLNSSNMLSLVRLFLAVPLWLLLDNFYENRMIVFALCIFALFTDLMDGYLARKLKQVTEMGKIIDPLADKIGIGAVVIKLFLIGQIPAYYFWMVILRDVFIFLGGIYVTNKIGKVLPSNMLGKLSVISIGFVILAILLNVDRSLIIFKLLYGTSLILIVGSFIGYVVRAMEFIKKKNYESV